ncbi:LLM class flavin-dependent oxidoreductase [Georgenia sp. Z1344]|uniref:LLM class flavin-dependent oxidoreductase n=1 Tax=Georgenia sp. Z1344 TaxID=3416706 RepID=UPI003CEECFD1
MKRIGFLSFGNWRDIGGSGVRTAADAHLQSIELAEAAEEIGIDGAYFRVHHFAPQLASPFPLLAAVAARTSRIEMGTGVIDMRYENPLYFAEEAAATDLIAGGRLQLGISRGSPEPALDGAGAFGYRAPEGESMADVARTKADIARQAIRGAGVVMSDPKQTGESVPLAVQPLSEGLDRRLWWGAGSRATARWAAEEGYNLMSSTLLTEDTGVPFDELQAEQIQVFRDAWAEAGHDWTPRVSVSRSVFPIVSDLDHRYFGSRSEESEDQVGVLEGVRARFGRTYAGEPDVVAAELASDAAVQAADTLLVTVPNMLGVDYNAALLESIVTHVAPALGRD